MLNLVLKMFGGFSFNPDLVFDPTFRKHTHFPCKYYERTSSLQSFFPLTIYHLLFGLYGI